MRRVLPPFPKKVFLSIPLEELIPVNLQKMSFLSLLLGEVVSDSCSGGHDFNPFLRIISPLWADVGWSMNSGRISGIRRHRLAHEPREILPIGLPMTHGSHPGLLCVTWWTSGEVTQAKKVYLQK